MTPSLFLPIVLIVAAIRLLIINYLKQFIMKPFISKPEVENDIRETMGSVPIFMNGIPDDYLHHEWIFLNPIRDEH